MKKVFIPFILSGFLSTAIGQQNLTWAKQFGGTGENEGRSIAVDANGNSYFTGYFGGTTDFDPGPNTYSLVSNGTKDFYVCKLNPDGSFAWVKQFGGNSYEGEEANHLVLDKDLNIYITGRFDGTVDFDPSPSVYTLSASNI